MYFFFYIQKMLKKQHYLIERKKKRMSDLAFELVVKQCPKCGTRKIWGDLKYCTQCACCLICVDCKSGQIAAFCTECGKAGRGASLASSEFKKYFALPYLKKCKCGASVDSDMLFCGQCGCSTMCTFCLVGPRPKSSYCGLCGARHIYQDGAFVLAPGQSLEVVKRGVVVQAL